MILQPKKKKKRARGHLVYIPISSSNFLNFKKKGIDFNSWASWLNSSTSEVQTSWAKPHNWLRKRISALLLLYYLISASAGWFPLADSLCHCWEWLIKISGLSTGRGIASGASLACFVLKESCKGSRQTGQVDCFLSHTSMQERWKLWPHWGMIRNTSFSWYSPKHIVHCASSMELKASWLNFIVGIAATTTGSRPVFWCSGCSRSILDSISNICPESTRRSLPQISLAQTNTMKVALIPNPITVVIKFMLEPIISRDYHSLDPNSQKKQTYPNSTTRHISIHIY